MSFDFKFRVPCDHKIKRERLSFESDRRTLLIPREVSNGNSYTLFVDGSSVDKNDEAFGYRKIVKHAVGDSLKRGTDAFVFIEGKEYILREKDVDQSSVVFRDLLDLVTVIGNQFFETFFDSNSYLHVNCLPNSVISNGTLIHVSYDFIPNFLETYSYDQDAILFDKMINDDRVVELSYTTVQKNCRKCHGIGVINDFYMNSVGNLDIVEDTDKLLQDAYIFTFTVKESDPFYPQLGTQLLELIGARNLGSLTNTTIQVEVNDALLLLKNIQQAQSKVQNLTPGEILRSFRKVEVVQDESDLTKFYVTVRLNSLSETDLEVSSATSFNRIA